MTVIINDVYKVLRSVSVIAADVWKVIISCYLSKVVH